jgi:hypothetical protein
MKKTFLLKGESTHLKSFLGLKTIHLGIGSSFTNPRGVNGNVGVD